MSCASLPVVGLAVGRQHRTHHRWGRLAAWARRLASASVPFFLPFIVPFAQTVLLGRHLLPELPTGLLERLMAALDLGILVLLGLWAHHAAPDLDRGPGQPQDRPSLDGPAGGGIMDDARWTCRR